jgi:TolA-binding protein
MNRESTHIISFSKTLHKGGAAFLLLYACVIAYAHAAALEPAIVALSKQVIEAKSPAELTAYLEEAKGIYFKEHRYGGFVEFSRSLLEKKKDAQSVLLYYIGFTRYSQLKYLEESQGWDEYFSQGNAYREELINSLEKCIETTSSQDPAHIYARLIAWKFHRDQQDVFHERAFSDLVNDTQAFAQSALYAKPIKDVADALLSYDEKGKAKELYRLYVNKIAGQEAKDEELEAAAVNFYKEGNQELSELLYDALIARLLKQSPKEKAVAALIPIAKMFSYQEAGAAHDAAYAESVFKKIEEVASKEAFDEELLYMRGFNLEKAKEYSQAKDCYQDLLKRFQSTPRKDELRYKVALIYAYVLRDAASAKNYFAELINQEAAGPQAIGSLYQLGLLSQWEDNAVKAKEYYELLLKKAGDNFTETAALTKERMQEIEESRPIEYNLKTFIDISLKEDYASLDMSKVDIHASLYKLAPLQPLTVQATAYTQESGCMQVALQYLWSGHTGTTPPSSEEASFDTSFVEKGTKEISLVVVSPTGFIDRNFDIVDVN